MNTETIALFISIIAAAAWIPSIIVLLKKRTILGKIISRYDNFNSTETFFLFKLGVLSKNKSFNLESIKCKIIFEDGTEYISKARNTRKVIFNGNEKLDITPDEYINNFTTMPKNTNISGYLLFAYNVVKDTVRIKKTIFIFTSFENKSHSLEFDEKDIDGQELLYDDSIWEKQ